MKLHLVREFAVLAFVISIGVFELDGYRTMFGRRSIVRDGVSGGDFWIVQVDGEPTERKQHGFFVSVVPTAVIAPGDHTIRLAETHDPGPEDDVFELHVTIERWVRYRVSTDHAGRPTLVARQ